MLAVGNLSIKIMASVPRKKWYCQNSGSWYTKEDMLLNLPLSKEDARKWAKKLNFLCSRSVTYQQRVARAHMYQCNGSKFPTIK